MRSIATATGLVLMLSAHGAFGQGAAPSGGRTPPSTASQLAEVCALPETDPDYVAARYFCLGVIYGVSQYHGAAHPVGGTRPPLFCVPTPPPRLADAATGFVAWVKAHPEYAQDSVADGLVRFAAQSFPCPPTQPAPATRRR